MKRPYTIHIFTEQLGSNHAYVAMSCNNLFLSCNNLLYFQEAKQYLENAIDISAEQLGSDHVKRPQTF